MPIAMTDGTTYENSLDMLFAKDMPGREETQGKMPAVPEPPRLPNPDLAPMNEEDQLHPNQPMDMHKTPESNFEAVMRGLGEIADQEMFKGPGFKRSQRYFQDVKGEEDTLPPNARPTAEEIKPQPSMFGQTFDKAMNYLKTAPEGSGFHPDFIPTAQQFIDAPWKEKLGFIMAASMMLTGPGRGMKVVKDEVIPPSHSDPLQFWKEGLAEYDKIEHPVINTLRQAEQGGSEVAGRLLEQYRKIDNPVMRQEFGNIVKQKIQAAAEGGETAPSNITNPEIKSELGPNKKWTPGELKLLKTWIEDPNGDLMDTPPGLAHRSEGAIFSRARTEGWIDKATEKYKRQPGDSRKQP